MTVERVLLMWLALAILSVAVLARPMLRHRQQRNQLQQRQKLKELLLKLISGYATTANGRNATLKLAIEQARLKLPIYRHRFSLKGIAARGDDLLAQTLRELENLKTSVLADPCTAENSVRAFVLPDFGELHQGVNSVAAEYNPQLEVPARLRLAQVIYKFTFRYLSYLEGQGLGLKPWELLSPATEQLLLAANLLDKPTPDYDEVVRALEEARIHAFSVFESAKWLAEQNGIPGLRRARGREIAVPMARAATSSM